MVYFELCGLFAAVGGEHGGYTAGCCGWGVVLRAQTDFVGSNWWGNQSPGLWNLQVSVHRCIIINNS